MMNEDDESRPRTPLLATPSLDRLGVDELHAYIEGLRKEIARTEAEITRKQGMRSAAESFFKSK